MDASASMVVDRDFGLPPPSPSLPCCTAYDSTWQAGPPSGSLRTTPPDVNWIRRDMTWLTPSRRRAYRLPTYLGGLWVAPQQRGRGFGKALIRGALEVAAAADSSAVLLHHSPLNPHPGRSGREWFRPLLLRGSVEIIRPHSAKFGSVVQIGKLFAELRST